MVKLSEMQSKNRLVYKKTDKMGKKSAKNCFFALEKI